MSLRSSTFRVFLSSTFRDLEHERNALQREVFPRLRDLAGSHGFSFQAIDLRWGIRQEATLDHRTLRICLNEVHRCQRMTPRPNFFVLLGDRYGWRPLPDEIPETEYDLLLASIRAMPTRFDEITRPAAGIDAGSLLDRWYAKDGNALRPVHVLRPRRPGTRFESFANWEREVARPLVDVLEKAAEMNGFSGEARLRYGISATHREVIHGALTVPDAEDHVFAFFRNIGNLDELTSQLADPRASRYLDTLAPGCFDANAHGRLRSLKADLEARLKGNVQGFEAKWTPDGVTNHHVGTLPDTMAACEELLGDGYVPRSLCEAAWRSLGRIIRDECTRPRMRGPDLEMNAHHAFAESRGRTFIGRQSFLDAIDSYLGKDVAAPLVIHGRSGSGKTSLIARSCLDLRGRIRHAERPDAVVVARHIGATPESTDLASLLEGLVRELRQAYRQPDSTVPTDVGELASTFADCLRFATAARPLVVFLDALDELTLAEGTTGCAWLPAALPPHVRLVLSVLTAPSGPFQALQARLPTDQFVALGPMPEEEGDAVLREWLRRAGRTLTPAQRQEAMRRFSRVRTPLYLQLLFEEARLWRSWDEVQAPEGPAEDETGAIRALLARLSDGANHGPVLVRRSLGYLAAARNGLAEAEILDLLSRDNLVMTDFRSGAQHSHVDDRLPPVIWSRLYFDLEPYLAIRRGDGTALLTFHHRLFAEVCRRSFLDESTANELHSRLAGYFGEQENWMDSGSIPNLRRLAEFPHHQRLAGDWNGLEDTLCDMEFLEAKCRGQGPVTLFQDFLNALDDPQLHQTAPHVATVLARFADTLRLNLGAFRKNPNIVFQQFYNQLSWEGNERIAARLEQAKAAREAAAVSRPILRLRTLPEVLLAGPLVRVFTDARHPIVGLAVADDESWVAASVRSTAPALRPDSLPTGELHIWSLPEGASRAALSNLHAARIFESGLAVVAPKKDSFQVWDLAAASAIGEVQGPAPDSLWKAPGGVAFSRKEDAGRITRVQTTGAPGEDRSPGQEMGAHEPHPEADTGWRLRDGPNDEFTICRIAEPFEEIRLGRLGSNPKSLQLRQRRWTVFAGTRSLVLFDAVAANVIASLTDLNCAYTVLANDPMERWLALAGERSFSRRRRDGTLTSAFVLVELETLQAHVVEGHGYSPEVVMFFPRSPAVATGSSDCSCRIWDLSRLDPTGGFPLRELGSRRARRLEREPGNISLEEDFVEEFVGSRGKTADSEPGGRRG